MASFVTHLLLSFFSLAALACAAGARMGWRRGLSRMEAIENMYAFEGFVYTLDVRLVVPFVRF